MSEKVFREAMADLFVSCIGCFVIGVICIIAYLTSGAGLLLFMSGFLVGLSLMGIVAYNTMRRWRIPA